jgi:hypothetical protein
MSGALSLLAASGAGSSGYATKYTGTITVALFPSFTAYGYNSTNGSLSPTTFGSITINTVADRFSPTVKSELILTGFSTDPGAAYVYSLKFGLAAEVVYGAASGAAYGYSTGTATWTFSTGTTVFSLSSINGVPTTMLIKGT